MFYLFLSIVFSVLLLVNFRFHEKFGIDTFQAIVFNYAVCFITAFIMLPAGVNFKLDLSQGYTWPFLLLGMAFIVTFILSGKATATVGMAKTSIANNVSLVIPVFFSLFIFNDVGLHYKQYLGIGLALVSIILATYQKADSQSLKSGRSYVLLFIVFLAYGLTNATINYFNIKYLKDPLNTIPYTMVMVLGAFFIGLIIWLFRIFKKEIQFKPKIIFAAICLGVPNFLSFYFLLEALRIFNNNGALVYPAYNIGVILLSTMVALVIFKEKLKPVNYFGLLLAVLAIILMFV